MNYLCLMCLCAFGQGPSEPAQDAFLLDTVEPDGEIVIGSGHPHLKGNKHGFEGGCAFTHEDGYHLFTAEMHGDPFWVAMRLGHWRSADLRNWERVGTVFQSKGKGFEDDPKYSIWSPMPVYNEDEERWNLFYICYRGALAPDESTHMYGRVYRAASQVPGRGGLDGPYEDVDVVLQPDDESMAWEGQQGTDSFYPYRVGNRWYSHYGSHNYEPISFWPVGLASAPTLAGPWRRLPEHSPLALEKEFIENPVVSRIQDYYVAVYDSSPVGPGKKYLHDGENIGYSFSLDGVDWVSGKRLAIHSRRETNWALDIRTPLGLIPLDNGEFAMLYTARAKAELFWNVGLVKVRAKFKKAGD